MYNEKLIEIVVSGLIKQRAILSSELTLMSFNESSFFSKQQALENDIMRIDLEINNHLKRHLREHLTK